ncbi:AraC family transcriptional regulator [Luteibacter anthropi]|uniref:helix-turn-helix transcriptional regulator n=1 Tax=Luteibacter anthropi TaxID=564369 RepID=UPI002032A3EB|nr:AraC family transcriptional regulator [Luteibacter anthropi]URX63620.1 AraC family transcriptional regulator [Luteibacter anthropi]
MPASIHPPHFDAACEPGPDWAVQRSQRTDTVAGDDVGRPLDGLLASRAWLEVPRYAGRIALASTRITLMASGRLLMDHRSGRQQASPGEVLLVRRCETYRVHADSLSGHVINLDVQPAYLRDLGLSEDDIALALTNSPGASLVLLRLFRESRTNVQQLPWEARAMLAQWLASSQRIAAQSRTHWAARLRGFLAEHWNERCPLKLLGEIAECHPVTIARYFPIHFGYTQLEYVRLLKTEQAVCQLLRTGHSVTDVAHRCGFSDHSHLTRTLRQLTGLTPVELRRLGSPAA